MRLYKKPVSKRTIEYNLEEKNAESESRPVNNYGSLKNFEEMSQSESTDNNADGQKLSHYSPAMEDDLRTRLQLYFTHPMTTLRNYRSPHWMMLLDFIKIVMITTQVIMFDRQRYTMLEYIERNELAFKHLLLKNWDPTHETLKYPPSTGKYALYSIQDLYEHIDFVTESYYGLPETSLASITHYHDEQGEPIPAQLCFTSNKYQEFSNGSYLLLAELLKNCIDIHPVRNGRNLSYDIKKHLKKINSSFRVNKTFSLNINFNVESFFNVPEADNGPTCYNTSVNIKYSNEVRSGQIVVDLNTDHHEIHCNERIIVSKAEKEKIRDLQIRYVAFDSAVIVCSVLSTVLCTWSLIRGNTLRKDTAKFFRLQRGVPLSLNQHLEFVNTWHIIIILNDALTVTGSAIKIQLDSRTFRMDPYNYVACSMLLGIGIFMTYVGMLRYLSFFNSYNVLIMTLRTSTPHVIRFLVCALWLYLGFLFCGWVVLAPYHIKFRRLSTASDCLFSLINGDDMFVTFYALKNHGDYVWYFQQAYLYVFISLFMYAVCSILFAVIMDNYEQLKIYYEKGFPHTDLEKFMNEKVGLTTGDDCHK